MTDITAPDASPWFLGFPAAAESPARLFCLPYAGGSAAAYMPWRRAADPRLGIIPVQLPGRGGRIREAPLHRLDRPYALFGHSLGALLAFETQRRLRDLGAPAPVALFVSARAAPHLPRRRPPLHRLSDDDLIRELKTLDGTPAAVFEDPELVALMLPILRADLAAVETHEFRHDDPLDCPIHAFGGDADSVTAEDLDGWRAHTRAFSGVTLYPGGHFYQNAHRTALVTEICGLFDRFRPGA